MLGYQEISQNAPLATVDICLDNIQSNKNADRHKLNSVGSMNAEQE